MWCFSIPENHENSKFSAFIFDTFVAGQSSCGALSRLVRRPKRACTPARSKAHWAFAGFCRRFFLRDVEAAKENRRQQG
jgi:hypothetical protein